MAKEARISERPLRRFGSVLGVSMLGGMLSGTVIGIAGAFGGETGPGFAMIVALAVAVGMGLGLWACWRWWQTLDEAAREAHKSAWFWGSTYGLSAGGVLLFSLLYSDGLETFADADPKDVFVAGIASVAVVQTLGYGIAWAVWWLRRR